MIGYQTDEQGIALGGLDPVSIIERASKTGRQTYSFEWEGAVWRFASAEHLDRFRSDPGRYAPQFGGHCALAIQFGKVAHSDPRTSFVKDGNIYLFASPLVRWIWRWFGNVRKSERNWEKMKAGAE